MGADPNPQVTGLEELVAKVNYFVGSDPKDWHTGIPTFAKVSYADVYPGVDLIYYGNQGKLEYDFVVAPGADPKVIKLRIYSDSSDSTFTFFTAASQIGGIDQNGIDNLRFARIISS